MIYDVNSPLFRSFLAAGGGSTHSSAVRCAHAPPALSSVILCCTLSLGHQVAVVVSGSRLWGAAALSFSCISQYVVSRLHSLQPDKAYC